MSFAIGSAGLNASIYRLDAAGAQTAQATAQNQAVGVEDLAAEQGVAGLEEGSQQAQRARGPEGGREPPPGGQGKGGPGGGPRGGPPPSGGAQQGTEADLAGSLVAQISASNSFLANLNSIESEDETLAALLKLGTANTQA